MAWFRLALALGMPVSEAQRRVSSSEFVEWQAFNNISPWGPERGDVLAAMIAWTTATSAHSGKGRRPKLRDFIPRWGEHTKAAATAQARALMVRLTGKRPDGPPHGRKARR